MQRKYMRLILLSVLLFSLSACGSTRSDDVQVDVAPRDLGSDASGVAFVGTDRCVNCHTLYALGNEQVTAYLGSKHVQHSPTIHAGSSPSCLSCHDPIGDGRTLEQFVPAANIPASGLAAVGCENCHGAGGDHFGIGPIQIVNPGVSQCGQCHAGLPSGPAGHASANNILGNYQDSPHADLVAAPGVALCTRCHSDEGFRQFSTATAGLESAGFIAFFTGVAAPPSPTVVQCRTCHDPHSGELRASATLDAEQRLQYSPEFNLCTSCHLVFLTATPDAAGSTFSYQIDTTRTTYLASGHPLPAMIEDTHFANPTAGISGYNINAAAANACTACHDAHGATRFTQVEASAIAEDWSASGHADYQGEPLAHVFTDPSCLKCHSGPQYSRFVQGVSPAALNISGGGQAVSCVACHDLTARDATDAFLLGALRPVESVTFPSGASVSLDGPSNLCMECHQGRSSTPTVNARIAAGNLSFSNIHYFAAAATLFGSEVQGGYEYAGRTYRGRNAFVPHSLLGRPDLTTCAGCHLRDDEVNHTFVPDLAACVDCHGGGEGGFESLDGSPIINAAAIQQLKDQLLGLLTASGVVSTDGYPYFANITTAQQLRAAYNWQLADKEPCGYIHNGAYIRQLLFDSIVDMGGTPVGSRPPP